MIEMNSLRKLNSKTSKKQLWFPRGKNWGKVGVVRENLGRDSHVYNIIYDTDHQGAPTAKQRGILLKSLRTWMGKKVSKS